MLMKIDEAMESGGGESSGDSRGSLSPMALSSRPKQPFSPPPDRTSPHGPPSQLHTSAHHMINSLAASSVTKNMTPGLLASLSALNAMSSAAAAASFHHHDFGGRETSSFERGLDRHGHGYGSPPAPMAPSNDPTANECKLVDYRGQKVAAFVINGDTMLCLPQAFELFLKHLVGGLHTVYTKLKRLDIVPLVCNVEQVRILRGLGAIQPGVNRCKLLSCKDFDVLYKDCTTASSRPGRPPKRTSVPLVPLSQHSSHSQFMAIKKHRLENGDYGPYDNNHHNAELMRLEKSPLLANGYNHPPTQIPPMHLLPLGGGGSAAAAAAVAAHSALFSPSGIPLPAGHGRDCRSAPLSSLNVARSAATWENCRTVYEDFVKHFESRYAHEDCSDSDEKSSQANEVPTGDSFVLGNGRLSGSPVLNLSKNTVDAGGSESEDEGGAEEEDDFSGSDDGQEPKRNYEGVRKDDLRKSPTESLQASHHDSVEPGIHHYVPPPGIPMPDPSELGLTSNENLLRNIQGLLKVAADNAKQQERRMNLEKAEMKMEAMRERELREQLEKELVEERNLRLYYEKRWRKERRFRKKLEEREDAGGAVGTGGDSPPTHRTERNPSPDSALSHHHFPHHVTHKINNNDRKRRSVSPRDSPKATTTHAHATNGTVSVPPSRDSTER